MIKITGPSKQWLKYYDKSSSNVPGPISIPTHEIVPWPSCTTLEALVVMIWNQFDEIIRADEIILRLFVKDFIKIVDSGKFEKRKIASILMYSLKIRYQDIIPRSRKLVIRSESRRIKRLALRHKPAPEIVKAAEFLLHTVNMKIFSWSGLTDDGPSTLPRIGMDLILDGDSSEPPVMSATWYISDPSKPRVGGVSKVWGSVASQLRDGGFYLTILKGITEAKYGVEITIGKDIINGRLTCIVRQRGK